MNQRLIATTLLCLGAFAGVALAAFGLLDTGSVVAKGGVARVNDVTIARTQFEQYLEMINKNSRTDKDEGYVLDRMIDEELLVQRGVELGMVNLNSTVRNAIVTAVTRRFAADQGDVTRISEDELARFYRDNLDYFTTDPQFTVAVIEPEGFPLPTKPLSRRSLGEYFGPTIANRIASLSEGEESGPLQGNGETYQFRLVEKLDAQAPPLADVRDLVVREFKRQKAEQAFNEYLAWLRDRAEIAVNLERRRG